MLPICVVQELLPLNWELLAEEIFLVRFGVSLILEEFLGCMVMVEMQPSGSSEKKILI